VSGWLAADGAGASEAPGDVDGVLAFCVGVFGVGVCYSIVSIPMVLFVRGGEGEYSLSILLRQGLWCGRRGHIGSLFLCRSSNGRLVDSRG
jgi:hypothetical protein